MSWWFLSILLSAGSLSAAGIEVAQTAMVAALPPAGEMVASIDSTGNIRLAREQGEAPEVRAMRMIGGENGIDAAVLPQTTMVTALPLAGGEKWVSPVESAETIRHAKKQGIDPAVLIRTHPDNLAKKDNVDLLEANNTVLKASLDECAAGGHWPSPFGANGEGKLDLVISWFTDKLQSSVKSHSLLKVSSRTKEDDELKIENNAEVKYQLRSFEKHGLLKHVRDVIFLMDSAVLEKYGAPRFFDYAGGEGAGATRNRIRVVTDKDIGVDNTGCEGCGKWSKRLAMHTIPGLSEYFIYTPDDVFMLKPFDVAAFFDAQSEKPVLHGFGTWTEGSCEGGQPVGTGHGPALINKCAYEAVAAHYQESGFRGGVMKGRNAMDAVCLYSNTMMSQWTFHNYGSGLDFFQECHTNGGCDLTVPPNAMFVNIQGDGVSDEYTQNSQLLAAAKNFLHSEFAEPSRFESQAEA